MRHQLTHLFLLSNPPPNTHTHTHTLSFTPFFSHSGRSLNKIATFCWIPFQIELKVVIGFFKWISAAFFEARTQKSLANPRQTAGSA